MLPPPTPQELLFSGAPALPGPPFSDLMGGCEEGFHNRYLLLWDHTDTFLCAQTHECRH